MKEAPVPSTQPRARWRVREVAEQRKWNAHKLAIAAGLSYPTMYRIWTNTSTRVDLDTIGILCQVLGVSPADIIEVTYPQE